jgi:hypothetical protein
LIIHIKHGTEIQHPIPLDATLEMNYMSKRLCCEHSFPARKFLHYHIQWLLWNLQSTEGHMEFPGMNRLSVVLASAGVSLMHTLESFGTVALGLKGWPVVIGLLCVPCSEISTN